MANAGARRSRLWTPPLEGQWPGPLSRARIHSCLADGIAVRHFRKDDDDCRSIPHRRVEPLTVIGARGGDRAPGFVASASTTYTSPIALPKFASLASQEANFRAT